MSRRRAETPSRRHLQQACIRATATLSLVVVSTGCLSINAYVSEDFTTFVEQVPLKADRPIARELRFVYADGNRISGLGGSTSFMVTTNETSIDALKSRGLRYIRETYPGIEEKHFRNSSDLQQQVYLQTPEFAAAGRAALDKSSTGEALSATEQGAASTFEVSRQLEQTVGMMNATLAAASALDSLVRAWHQRDGNALGDWVARETGAIGPSAPEGSILFVDFVRVLSAQSFTTSSDTDFVVSARLERRGRKTIEAVRGMKYNVSTGQPPPADQLVGLTDYKTARKPLLEKPEIQSLSSIVYAMEHATLANAAIADLYRQLGIR